MTQYDWAMQCQDTFRAIEEIQHFNRKHWKPFPHPWKSVLTVLIAREISIPQLPYYTGFPHLEYDENPV
jgi:hypothetical protein